MSSSRIANSGSVMVIPHMNQFTPTVNVGGKDDELAPRYNLRDMGKKDLDDRANTINTSY